jgi:hypothetical protein
MGCNDICSQHGFTINRAGQCVVCTPDERLKRMESCGHYHHDGPCATSGSSAPGRFVDDNRREGELAMTPEVAASMVIGPDDHLVLISKRHITPDEMHSWTDHLPAALHGRVLVVDGTTLDAKVVRGQEGN